MSAERPLLALTLGDPAGVGPEVVLKALLPGTLQDRCRPLVTTMQNTVEDFIWDNMRRYLVVICYMTTIALADFETGEKLDLVRDQLDYSKGLMWLDPTPDPRLYPYDFVTWGRSGDVHQFRIHDEQLVALGPVGVPLD